MTETTLNQFISSGTNAERLAYTPVLATPAAGNNPSVVFIETDTGDSYMWDFGGSAWLLTSSGGGGITTLTGDVTATGPGSAAATIANNAVTLAKIAHAAASSKILGSGASGSGANYVELTLGTNLSMSGTTLNAASGTGTVTHTGALTSGQLVLGNGTADIAVGDLTGDVTTSGSGATTIAANAVTTTKINNSAVTLAKIANAAANSKLLGSGAAGSGSAYTELTLGANLSMSGTTLNATGGAMTKIASSSPSGTNTVAFTSIAATFSALKIVGMCRTTNTGSSPAEIELQFNSDAAANYQQQRTFSNGSTPLAQQTLGKSWIEAGEAPAVSDAANYAGYFEVIIPFYANTTFYKSALVHYTVFNNTTTASLFDLHVSGHWDNTAAINRIDLTLSAGNWAAGSQIVLYGLS